MKLLYAFNRLVEKWMALVTPLCLLVGVLFPNLTGKGLPFVPVVFGFISFVGGLNTRFRDVGNVFKRPLPLLLTLLTLHVILPLAACGVGRLFFPQDPNLITGMVLEFVVPTAVVSLMWVSIYRGDSPLSLSVVVVDTVLSPFLIPLSLQLLLGSTVEMDTADMMRQLLFMIAIPAVAAMLLNELTKGKSRSYLPGRLAPFSKLALIFVVTCNSSKVAPYIRSLTPKLVAVAGCILILAAGGYAVGWLIGVLSHQKRDAIVSLTFGSGMRNISAGAVLAAAYFPAEVMFPVMIGTLFQQVLAATYGALLKRRYGLSDDTSPSASKPEGIASGQTDEVEDRHATSSKEEHL